MFAEKLCVRFLINIVMVKKFRLKLLDHWTYYYITFSHNLPIVMCLLLMRQMSGWVPYIPIIDFEAIGYQL